MKLHVTGTADRTDTNTHTPFGEPVKGGPDTFTRRLVFDATITLEDLGPSAAPAIVAPPSEDFAARFQTFLAPFLSSLAEGKPIDIPKEFAGALAAYLSGLATGVTDATKAKD